MRDLIRAAILASILVAPGAAAGEVLEIPYETYTLDNGLQVILHHAPGTPLVAVNVWYHVGAYHEVAGRTGFAHLFEHMMFQGSEHVGDDQHFKILEGIGASSINGTTNFDRTNYFETVPSNQLEVGLWLESDRMGFMLPALTLEKLDNQREVVKNERRQSLETQPYGLAEERMWQALFPKPHPYHGMVIGSMDDLNAATVDDVKGFFRTWYAPSNATLTVAGDYDPATIKGLVDKWFGTLPKQPKPAATTVLGVGLKEEVVIRHDETIATLPKVVMAWHSAPLFKEGDATADVLASVLSDGKATRLQKRLIHELEMAQSVSASQYSMGARSLFFVEAVARPGVDLESLKAEVDKVLAEVREGKVTADEVRRAVTRWETSFVSRLQKLGGFGGKADRLQTYNHFLADPDFIAKDLDRYRKVTPEIITAFSKETLDPARRVLLYASPVKKEAK
jgi:zinc protease